jgi:hypothetical protein
MTGLDSNTTTTELESQEATSPDRRDRGIASTSRQSPGRRVACARIGRSRVRQSLQPHLESPFPSQNPWKAGTHSPFDAGSSPSRPMFRAHPMSCTPTARSRWRSSPYSQRRAATAGASRDLAPTPEWPRRSRHAERCTWHARRRAALHIRVAGGSETWNGRRRRGSASLRIMAGIPRSFARGEPRRIGTRRRTLPERSSLIAGSVRVGRTPNVQEG